MDFNMPQMNGLDATGFIKAYYKSQGVPSPTIIGLTGDLDERAI
jgi:CheY-like chemotaxis protein